MKIYITEMLRWGTTASHHYIIGAYSTKEAAEQAGDAIESWRGGKYEARVVECDVDAALPDEILSYHKACAT
jgi:hypothetical protein